MKKEKLKIERTVVENGTERPKTLYDYTGEELDQLSDEDPEYESNLWSEAELEAINNPDNHDKSN